MMATAKRANPEWLRKSWEQKKNETAARVRAAVEILRQHKQTITYESIRAEIKATCGISISANTIKRNEHAYEIYEANRAHPKSKGQRRNPQLTELFLDAPEKERRAVRSKISRLRRETKDILIARLITLERAVAKQSSRKPAEGRDPPVERDDMSERGAKLKHPTGWFAAGREVARALRMLSDGAFKMCIHLCLTADRGTGRVATGHTDLVKALGKSRRSVMTYLEELRREGVCKVQCAVNQHAGGEIEICDPFWPYERAPPEADTATQAGYVERIRQLLKSWRCVQVSVSAADEKVATALFARGVPLDQIERGITLACARKYVAL